MDRLSRLIAVATHAPFLSAVMWNRYVRRKHNPAQIVGVPPTCSSPLA